jgi:hypothetical protein
VLCPGARLRASTRLHLDDEPRARSPFWANGGAAFSPKHSRLHSERLRSRRNPSPAAHPPQRKSRLRAKTKPRAQSKTPTTSHKVDRAHYASFLLLKNDLRFKKFRTPVPIVKTAARNVTRITTRLVFSFAALSVSSSARSSSILEISESTSR